jgi:hypothetical protein
MAQFELGITIEGLDALDNQMRVAGYRAIAAEPALREILTVMHESEKALWESKPWPENATATLENKSSTEPLIRTGALERSLIELGDKNSLVEIGPATLKFGTKLWYAHFALGTVTEPKRDLFKLKAAHKREIQLILGNFIAHGKTVTVV